MSIFNSGSGMNPLPWLREKTLRALQAAVHLVDIANEPDTTEWYAKTLRGSAMGVVGRLAPVVALLFGAGEKAANEEEWRPIAEGGSLALARWCKKYDIADPFEVAGGAVASDWDEEDRARKAETTSEAVVSAEDPKGLNIKLEIYWAMSRRLLDEDLPREAQRLLLWLLYNLRLSRHADVCVVSKRFLPGDTRLGNEETLAAYRTLYERGLIQRVDGLVDDESDRLAVRLIEEGFNDSRHPTPFREETFGFPGNRIDGQPTFPMIMQVKLSEALGPALNWWSRDTEGLDALRQGIMAAIGENRLYVEHVEIQGEPGDLHLEVRLRHLRNEDDETLRRNVQEAVHHWLRAKLNLAPKS